MSEYSFHTVVDDSLDSQCIIEINDHSWYMRNHVNSANNAKNRFRRDRLFKIGDTVFIKIQTLKSKLSPLFKGPCTVVKVHNTKYSYDVEDPQGVLYQVHVNNMK